VNLSASDALQQVAGFRKEAARTDGEAEHFGQLADQHGQRDAVDIAVPDGPGEKIGNEAEFGQASQNAQQPRQNRQHGSQRHRLFRIAGGKRQNRRGDEADQRGVRSQNHNAAGTENGIGDQRNDGGIQTVNGGQARCRGIAHPHRNQEGCQGQSGGKVAPQPTALIPAQRRKQGNPAGKTATVILTGKGIRFRILWSRHGAPHGI